MIKKIKKKKPDSQTFVMSVVVTWGRTLDTSLGKLEACYFYLTQTDKNEV